MRYLWVLLLCLPGAVRANDCFNFADTYYQQIYCEIRASGHGASLPAFVDFRRNDEQMQALLLKPHARRAGIAMTMPRPPSTSRRAATRVDTARIQRDIGAQQATCAAEALELRCGNARYHLVVNRDNAALAADALAPDHKMALPVFTGDRRNPDQVNAYLVDAYHHYLEKMLAIGLGGSTLSFGKFAYLFEDLAQKSISFSDRFEVMYRYLKADKRKLSVPVRSRLPAAFDPQQCFPLQRFMVCQAGLVNLVFEVASQHQ